MKPRWTSSSELVTRCFRRVLILHWCVSLVLVAVPWRCSNVHVFTRQVFADIDINGDGSLSYDEFRACLGKLSLDPTLTEDDVTKLLGAIDSNA
jgi:hypothetical protein